MVRVSCIIAVILALIPMNASATCDPYYNVDIDRARSDVTTLYTGERTGVLGYDYRVLCGSGSIDRILVDNNNRVIYGRKGVRNESRRKDVTYNGRVNRRIWHQVYVPCSAAIGTADWIVRAYSERETFVGVGDVQVDIQPGLNCGPV